MSPKAINHGAVDRKSSRRHRFDDDEYDLAAMAVDTNPDAPPEGERWTTWDGAAHGPKPRPDWVITALGAVDQDLGVLKTGKEADVHLVRRWVPGEFAEATMAAKRYRSHEHRMFHRDAGYLEGRRVRRSREMRAMASRTEFGKSLITGMWAGAEFEVLCTMWDEGLPVPYPVSFDGSELLMELVSDDGVAAPRLAQSRPDPTVLPLLWDQLREAMLRLAELGWAHGDLSPFNVLLAGEGQDSRIVIIDWPQIVDVIGNTHGPEFLERDARTMCEWFVRRGFHADAGELFGELMAAATNRW